MTERRRRLPAQATTCSWCHAQVRLQISEHWRRRGLRDLLDRQFDPQRHRTAFCPACRYTYRLSATEVRAPAPAPRVPAQRRPSSGSGWRYPAAPASGDELTGA